MKSVIKGGRKYSDDSDEFKQEGPDPVCLFQSHLSLFIVATEQHFQAVFIHVFSQLLMDRRDIQVTRTCCGQNKIKCTVFIFDLQYLPFPSNQSSVYRCNSKQCF